MDFVVHRKRLSDTATVQAAPLVLNDGEILVRVIKFAFTANNVSYATTGDALGYWNFFPLVTTKVEDGGKSVTAATTITDSAEEWGRIPVWGVGIVVASRCGLSTNSSSITTKGSCYTNRRVYGYFPMSHYVVLRPVGVTQADFMDGKPHRKGLPAVYNQYVWCDEDPFYSPRTEDAMMVLRPLFVTSWLIVDFFLHPDQREPSSGKPFLGAKTVIISSASSKTSIGLAFLLYQKKRQSCNDPTIRVVGLTSRGNFGLVESLRIYDQIVLYDNLERDLDALQPSCFVDMAGNTRLTTRLHQHLQQNMVYSCLVGASHVGQGGKPISSLSGAKPRFFFAPDWTAQRIKELGGGPSTHQKGKLAANNKRNGLKVRPSVILAHRE